MVPLAPIHSSPCNAVNNHLALLLYGGKDFFNELLNFFYVGIFCFQLYSEIILLQYKLIIFNYILKLICRKYYVEKGKYEVLTTYLLTFLNSSPNKEFPLFLLLGQKALSLFLLSDVRQTDIILRKPKK